MTFPLMQTPSISIRNAGFQREDSGTHYRKGLPILVQFPPEILCCIFEKMEPIWMMQASYAYKETASFLCSEVANKLWYNAIPPALRLEPEFFQSLGQMKVSRPSTEWFEDSIVSPRTNLAPLVSEIDIVDLTLTSTDYLHLGQAPRRHIHPSTAPIDSSFFQLWSMSHHCIQKLSHMPTHVLIPFGLSHH